METAIVLIVVGLFAIGMAIYAIKDFSNKTPNKPTNTGSEEVPVEPTKPEHGPGNDHHPEQPTIPEDHNTGNTLHLI